MESSSTCTEVASQLSPGQPWYRTPLVWWLGIGTSAGVAATVNFLQLWDLISHRFVALVLLGFIGLTFWRWNRVCYFPRTYTVFGLVALVAICLWGSVLASLPWLGGCALASLMAAFAFGHVDRENQSLSINCLPCISLIRLPSEIESWIETKLNIVSAHVAGVIFELLGFIVRMQANAFEVASGHFSLNSVLRGFNSFWCVLFFALMVMAWKQRTLWLAPVYLIAACLSSIAMNIFQLLVVVVVSEKYSVSLLDGFSYMIVVSCALTLALVLLISFDQLLQIVTHPINRDSSSLRETNPLVKLWDQIASPQGYEDEDKAKKRATFESPVLANILLVVMLLSVIPQVIIFCQSNSEKALFVSLDKWLPENNLLQSVGGDWEVRQYENKRIEGPPLFGQHAHFWKIETPSSELLFTVNDRSVTSDFSKPIGWQLLEEACVTLENIDHTRFTFVNDNSVRACMLVRSIDQQGQIQKCSMLSSSKFKKLIADLRLEKSIDMRLWIEGDITEDEVKLRTVEAQFNEICNRITDGLTVH